MLKQIKIIAKKVKSTGGPKPAVEPHEAAEAAGLIYVSQTSKGFTRRRQGKGFVYLGADGKRICDKQTVARISALVIPPAWKNVWICLSARGHLQVVGQDEKGRKQYRYHEKFRQVRDEAKYSRMMAFVSALPRVRRRVSRDLRQRGMPREKVLAAVVKLLETTLIRVGNEEYASQNGHFGLTTLRNRHVNVRGDAIHFHFKGKSGVDREVDLNDPRLAKIVRKCQDLPGEELFGYVDDKGQAHDISSTDVNDYLREASGQEFTAKDFRTWAGTVLAAKALREFEKFDSEAQAKKNILRAIESVAKQLGNTKAVCRKCYIHPGILTSYMDGELGQTFAQRASQMEKKLAKLPAEEAAVLVLLQRRLASEKKRVA